MRKWGLWLLSLLVLSVVLWLVTVAVDAQPKPVADLFHQPGVEQGDSSRAGAAGGAAGSTAITVEAGTVTGQIRSLQGVNAGPQPQAGEADLTNQYRAIGVDFVRTHDYYGPADINTLFPVWSADPTLETSYHFTETDAVIWAIKAAGADVLFRLGYSWGTPAAPVTYIAPAEQAKWAEVAKHVVMHYNDGWANGFHYNIRYWEVWNEPDIRIFWTGTPQEYYTLYEATAQALKSYDPTLKVGGPALAGSWPFLRGFLNYVRDHTLPLDFISWHTYSTDPDNAYRQSLAIRDLAAEYSYPAAEVLLTEWNHSVQPPHDEYWNARGAAWTASVLTYLQDSPVTVSTRYRGNGGGVAFGLFNQDGSFKKTAYAYLAHRMLLATPQRLAATGADTSGYAVIAGKASDNQAITILISDYQSSRTGYTLQVNHLPWGEQPFLYDRYLLDATHDLSLVESRVISGTTVFSTTETMAAESVQVIRLHRPEPAVFLVSIDGLRGSEAFDAPDPAVFVPNLWHRLRPLGTIYQNFLNKAQTYTTPGNNTLVNGVWAFAPNIGEDVDLRAGDPTFFEYYRQAYPTVAREKTWAVVSKANVRLVDYSLHPAYGEFYGARLVRTPTGHDPSAWAALQQVMDQAHPTLVFFHLGEVDIKGHSGNWLNYTTAISQADAIIGALWDKIQSDPAYKDQTTLIVTSDHGRFDDAHGGFSGHGGISESNKRLPFLAVGPGIRAGLVVTETRSQVDIVPTIGHILGFETPLAEGRVLIEMFSGVSSTLAVPASTLASETWSLGQETRLTNAPGRSERPALAVASDGWHVVWADDRSGQRQVYYKHRPITATTWTDDLLLSSNGVEARAPAIVAAPDGVHVVWHDYRDGNWTIMHRHRAANGDWSAETPVALSTVEGSSQGMAMLWEPALVALTDRVCVGTPTYGSGVRVYCSTDGGDTWVRREVVAVASNAQHLVLAAAGTTLHATWTQLADNNWEIFYCRSSDGGTTWSLPSRLTYSPADSWQPALAVEGGRVHVAWADDRSGTFQLWYRRSADGGLTWSVPVTLTASAPDGGAWHPAFAAGADGRLWLTWEDYRNGNGEIYYLTSTNGGRSWSNERRVTWTAALSVNPRPAATAQGAYLVWQEQQDRDWEIYFIEEQRPVPLLYRMHAPLVIGQDRP